jgi:hypothetical protein
MHTRECRGVLARMISDLWSEIAVDSAFKASKGCKQVDNGLECLKAVCRTNVGR